MTGTKDVDESTDMQAGYRGVQTANSGGGLRTSVAPVLLATAALLLVFVVPATVISLLIVDHMQEDLPSGTMAAAGIGFVAAVCLVIALGITTLANRWFIRPMRQVMVGMQRLADGDFGTRIQLGRGYVPPAARAFVANFNRTAQELGSVELLRRDFTDSFSHEFKTPIASIGGFARLLQQDGLTEEQRAEFIGIIAEESDRLAQLANDVLALTRAESQEILADAGDVDVTDGVRRAILIVGSKWAERNVAIDVELEEAHCQGNAELLDHVWVNLLDNAVKFSPDEGRVRVGLHVFPESIAFSVADEGPGMDEAVQRRIFERFYQADPAHGTPGNGLGLPMVKRVVDLHGGTVLVRSTPGAGSTFTVSLPRRVEG